MAGSYFTLQPVTPNSNDPFSFDSATKFNAKPVGTSLDHVMAQQLSPNGTPLFMRVGNSGGSNGESPLSNISYLKADGAAATAAASIYPGLGTPSQVFTALTGLFGKGSTSPDTYAMTRGKKVTDCVKDDLASFERLDMSAEDKNKVAVWKAMLNDVGSIMASRQCTAELATRLGATQANVSKAGMGGVGKDILTTAVTTDLDGADMYSVLAVLAAACNYNPVIFLKYPPNYTFTGLGINNDSHNLSHRLDSANMTGLATRTRWPCFRRSTNTTCRNSRSSSACSMASRTATGRHSSTAPPRFGSTKCRTATPTTSITFRSFRQAARGLLQDGLDGQRRYHEHRGRHPDPGQQRVAVRERHGTGQRHHPRHRNPCDDRQRTHQQIFLQPDECHGREG